MRNLFVLAMVLIAGGVGLSGEARALQVLGAWRAQANLVQPAQYYPPNTYRPYGYDPSVEPLPPAGVATQAPIADDTYVPPPPVTQGAIPQAPVVVPSPAAGAVLQPPVVQAPVVMVPVRPASCGEFRFWNGFACVDARFNTPYLGPRY